MTSPLLAHFDEQARACESMGSPFTARLIERLGRDLEHGGPVADLVADWSGHPRADAVALRLTGALHAAVLGARDPDLVAAYPAIGRHGQIDAAWPAARDWLARERDWVAAFLQSPPQTNEVRRSIVLLAGFLAAAEVFRCPFETLELGASAGLNVSWDRFAYRTDGWSWNPGGEVFIDTDWQGPPPPTQAPLEVRARAACDQSPLDLSDPAQRLRLKSYIWPDQLERLARFDAAADVAVARGVHVDRADAAVWLAERLGSRPRDAGAVVYHSVFLQYPTRETRRSIRETIERAGTAADARAPLAWLRFEPEAMLGGPRDSSRLFVDLITWPGGARRVLLETDGHARWVRAAGG